MADRLKYKIQAFEYVVFRLIESYKIKHSILNYSDFNARNDFSKLKVIKLHFFVSAVNSSTNSLLSVFDDFYAMPYGHVESEIFSHFHDFQLFSINKRSLVIKDVNKLGADSFSSLDSNLKTEIDLAVESLLKINHSIIDYTASQLVELSHEWSSWKSMFSFARSNNRFSESIPSSFIKDEVKTFELAY